YQDRLDGKLAGGKKRSSSGLRSFIVAVQDEFCTGSAAFLGLMSTLSSSISSAWRRCYGGEKRV
ncbi:hypothetical protein, partial [Endozoicomonas sp. ONNA2]|uniref:hypothetical protein n=1 Tax=Endozoicomonas sp. ONNA2 TaxID=2828741 RepID=UPI0021474768